MTRSNDPPTNPGNRRLRLRRGILRLGMALGVCLVLSALAASFLQSSYVEERLRRLIVRQTESLLGGTAELDLFELDLLNRSVVVGGFELAPDPKKVPMGLELGHAKVHLRNGGLVGRLESLDLSLGPFVNADEGGLVETTIAGWLRLLKLREVTVENGRLRIFDEEGPFLDLEGLRGHVQGLDSFDVSAAIERATLDVGGGRLVASPADLAGRLDDLGVHVNAARIERGVSWIDVKGVLSPTTAAQGDLAVDFIGDASIAQIWVPDLPIAGTASGAGEVHVDAADTAVELRAVSRDLVFQDLGPLEAEAEVRVDRRSLVWSGETRAYGGSAVSRGTIDFVDESALTFDVTLDELDPTPLLRDLGAGDLVLATRISGQLSLQVARQRLGGHGQFDLAPANGPGAPVQGRIELGLDEGVLHVSAPRLALPGLTARLEGSLEGQRLSGTMDTRILDVGEMGSNLVRAGLLDALPDILEQPTGGVVTVRGEIGGRLGDPHFEGTIHADELVVAERRFVFSTEVLASKERVELRRLDLSRLDGYLELLGEGAIDVRQRTLEATVHSAQADLASLLPPEAHLDLAGRVTLSGRVGGSLDAPKGGLALGLTELSWRDSELPDLQFEIESDGKAATAWGAAQGRRLAVGQLELASPYPLEAELDLAAVPWEELLPAIPQLPEIRNVSELRGLARAELTLEDPRGSLTYRLDVEGLVAGPEQRVTIDPFSIVGDWRAAELTTLRLYRGESYLAVSGRVPLSAGDEMALEARGAGKLDLVTDLFPAVSLDGQMGFDLSIRGPMTAPAVVGRATVQSPRGEWGELTWDDLEIALTMATDHVHIEHGRARILDGRIELEGDLPLSLRPGGPRRRLELAATGVDLARLLPSDVGDGELRARVSTRGWLESSALVLDDLHGAGSIRVEEAGSARRLVRTVHEASWNLEGSRAEVRDLRLLGERGELELDATASFEELPPDFELSLAGEFDLSLLEFLAGRTTQVALDGPASVELRFSQQREERSWSGSVTAREGRIELREPRATISDLEVSLGFENDSVEISTFKGRMGPGDLEVGGSITLPGLADLGAMDLLGRLHEAPIEIMEGVRVVVSGDARLHGDEQYRLEGQASIARGLFDRAIDAADAETDFLAQVRSSLLRPDEETLSDRISVDLRLRSEGDFAIRNELAQLEVGGTLDIQGTLADPSLFGTLTAQPQGVLILGRNRFDLERATVRFDGVPDQPLEIELEAWTEVAGSSIALDVRGPLDAIETELRSPDPELTQADLASMLLTGRRMDAASEGVREIAAAQAATYMSDILGSQIGLDLGLVFGTLADFPFLSSEVDPASQFTVGRRVTDKLSVAYSRGLDDSEKEFWIIDYQPLPRFWLRAVQSQGSAYTLEVAHRRQFEYRQRPVPEGTLRRRSSERIGEVTIAGDVPAELDLEGSLDLKIGRRYDFWAARDQAERLRRRLVDAGYRSAWVDVATAPMEGNAVAIHYAVEVGPPTELEWTGDDPGGALWKEIERRWDGRILEEFLIEELSELAREDLQKRGFYGAAVSVSTESTSRGQRVVFNFEHGPRGQGVDVQFSGNETLSDDELFAALPPPDSRIFFSLIGGRHHRLRDVLALRYANEGHLDVAVLGVRTDFAGENGPLLVEIELSEGPLFEVGSIHFEGNASLAADELHEVIGLQQGDPFVVSRYVKIRGDLIRHYRTAGFWGTGVRVQVNRSASVVDLTFVVEEGLRARVGSIEVEGVVATHEQLLRRQLTFAEGQPLASPQLLDSQRRLYELGLFRVVDIESVVTDDPSVRDVIVTVREMPDLVLDLGIRYRDADAEALQPGIGSVSSGIEPAFRAKFFQPFGGGGNVLLSLYPRFDGVLARASHQRNLFVGLRLPTELYAEAQREYVEEIDRDVEHWNITFQQYKVLSEQLRLQWSYQYGQSRLLLDDLSTRPAGLTDEWLTRGRISTSLILDRRDNPILPQRGYFANATLQIADGVLGSEIDYVRLYGQISLLVPLGSGENPWIWASGVRLGTTFIDEAFPFLDDRFTAGGAYSVRGFRTRGLGPTFEGTGLALGGEALAVFNQELRFPLWRQLHGGVFVDAGNVFALREDFDLGDLRTSAGFGLRLQLPFGVIRGDYSWILDREEGEPSGQFHIAFGHAF